MSENNLETLLKPAVKSTPSASKKKRCVLCTPTFIASIHKQLTLSNPLHAAVYACLTTTFYSAAHLSKFTVPNLDAFNPQNSCQAIRLTN